jgi:hypothetical protein
MKKNFNTNRKGVSLSIFVAISSVHISLRLRLRGCMVSCGLDHQNILPSSDQNSAMIQMESVFALMTSNGEFWNFHNDIQ